MASGFTTWTITGIFGSHDATMQVEAIYTAPNRKDFKVISETGSKLLINHVLLKLLSSEQEAQEEQNRKELEISPKNYDFALAGTEHTPSGDFYVLAVSPKGKSKYLYRGNFGWTPGISRLHACKASPPRIHLSGSATLKLNIAGPRSRGFWLPVHNESETQVRMGGKAVLTIDYSDYQVTGMTRSDSHGLGENPILPNPSAVSADPH